MSLIDDQPTNAWRRIVVYSLGIAGVIGLGAWVYAQPYLTMSEIREAAKAGDTETLAELVDFPSLRESLKETFKANMLQETTKLGEQGLFAGVAVMMVDLLFDKFVNAAVSPGGIAAMTQGKPPTPPTKGPGLKSGPLALQEPVHSTHEMDDPWSEASMGYVGWSKFNVRFIDKKTGQEVIVLTLRRRGLSWQLTSLRLQSWTLSKEAVNLVKPNADAKNIEVPSSGTRPPHPAPESAYLDKIIIKEVTVGSTTLGGKGVFGEVKNGGDRAVSEVEITIYYLDKNRNPIFEKSYHPVLVSNWSFGDSNAPLKPGYSRKFGVKVDDAPSEWSGKVEVKVTKIAFAKDQARRPKKPIEEAEKAPSLSSKDPDLPRVSDAMPDQAVKAPQRSSISDELNRELDEELKRVKEYKPAAKLDIPKEAPMKPVPQQEAAIPQVKAPQTQLKTSGASGTNPFWGRVEAIIKSHWEPPPFDVSGQPYSAVIRFRYYRNGAIKDVVVQQTSGNSYFDMAGQRAILKPRQFPDFPADMTDAYQDLEMVFRVGESAG